MNPSEPGYLLSRSFKVTNSISLLVSGLMIRISLWWEKWKVDLWGRSNISQHLLFRLTEEDGSGPCSDPSDLRLVTYLRVTVGVQMVVWLSLSKVMITFQEEKLPGIQQMSHLSKRYLSISSMNPQRSQSVKYCVCLMPLVPVVGAITWCFYKWGPLDRDWWAEWGPWGTTRVQSELKPLL